MVKWKNGQTFDGAVAVSGGNNFGMLIRVYGTVWAMGNNGSVSWETKRLFCLSIRFRSSLRLPAI
ncbi:MULTISPECIES: hypothetical protein [unclassified Paenibacillus]|uniref:hypothetical protein n=1 Tax=unclassified Paenibacillus TaxID=185978 RepID=UPI000A5EBBF8|nr:MULTISPECIES: hypothetical protein [unclassified Paenibacillus]